MKRRSFILGSAMWLIGASSRGSTLTSYGKSPITVRFVGGDAGLWKIKSIVTVTGDTGIGPAERMTVLEDAAEQDPGNAAWILRGFTSNIRYTNHSENETLVARQAALGRKEATLAALIPIRKNKEWWALTQDERREIFEEQSKHIAIGTEYLPAIARRLHHSRDLNEPFDFLTWFEYAPEHSSQFEELVKRLRATQEWKYVDREIDIRLVLN